MLESHNLYIRLLKTVSFAPSCFGGVYVTAIVLIIGMRGSITCAKILGFKIYIFSHYLLLCFI